MRSHQQIKNEILAEIAKNDVLTNHDSDSKSSIWGNWVFVISISIWLHEKIVENNAKNSRVHTVSWYREQALAFLNGVDLIWKNGQFAYPNIEDKEVRQVIKRCAIVENKDGQLVIKITGENNIPVNKEIERRFTAYMNEIKDAGNRLMIINREADSLKITIDVYVDTLVIDLSTGQYLEIPQEFKPVENAIQMHLNSLKFDGALYVQQLEREILNAQGVEDLKIQILEHKYGQLPYLNIDRFVIPDAGHFSWSEVIINYISNVENR